MRIKTNLDNELEFVSATPSEGDYDDNKEEWDIDSTDLGESFTLEIVAMVKDDVEICEELSNEAWIERVKDAEDIVDENNDVETFVKPGALPLCDTL